MKLRPNLQEQTASVGLMWRLSPGTVPEPPVCNRAFLQAFVETGAWIRVANSFSHLEVLKSENSSDIQRLSALVGLYEQAALQAEDVLSNLIVWSYWSKDHSQNIADLLSRVMLKEEPSVDNYKELIEKRFSDVSKKRVYVDPRRYLTAVAKVSASSLPSQFGIPWKQNPRASDVPNNEREWWNSFPSDLSAWLEDILNPMNGLVRNMHNKIKHGPQLIVTSLLEVGLSRGYSDDGAKPDVGRSTIRVLLDGSRTQETDREFADNATAAPILVPDIRNAETMFTHLIRNNAWHLANMAEWIFRFAFRESRPSFSIDDRFLRNVLESM
jgi:hypothetical protein